MDGQVFVSIQGFVFFLFFISNIHILSRIIVMVINTIGAKCASIPAPNAAAANLPGSNQPKPGRPGEEARFDRSNW